MNQGENTSTASKSLRACHRGKLILEPETSGMVPPFYSPHPAYPGLVGSTCTTGSLFSHMASALVHVTRASPLDDSSNLLSVAASKTYSTSPKMYLQGIPRAQN